MSMSKQDFIALADVLRDHKPNPEHTQSGSPMREYVNGRLVEWEDTRDRLADFCASQNPRFDRARWIGYINGENGKAGGRVK